MNISGMRKFSGLRVLRATASVAVVMAVSLGFGVGSANADDTGQGTAQATTQATTQGPAVDPAPPAADTAGSATPAAHEPAPDTSTPPPDAGPVPAQAGASTGTDDGAAHAGAGTDVPGPVATPVTGRDPRPGPSHPTGGCTSYCNEGGISVSASVHPEFTRTYSWKIDKQIREVGDTTWPTDDTVTWTGDTTSHPFEYRIVVSRTGAVDSDWRLIGSVTVRDGRTDPSAPSVGATITQPTTLGGVPSSCRARAAGSSDPWSAAPLTLDLGPGQARSLDIECTFATQPGSGTYAPTVTAAAAVAQAAPAAFAFTDPTTRINAEVTAVDDRATPSPDDDVIYEPVSWNDDCGCGVTVAHYTLVHVATTSGCSAENTWTNTATLYNENGVVLTTDSTTAAICVTTPPTTTTTPPSTTVTTVSPPTGTKAAPPAETPEVLPNTGGPSWVPLYAGLGLVALGGALVAGRRQRADR